MNLGIFLGIGESLNQMKKSGQKDRFINLYLKEYLKTFNKIYLFSYEKEAHHLPNNVILVQNKLSLHKYIYAFLISKINQKQIKDCDVFRGFGLTSFIPAIIISKPFVFNFPYDYSQFLKIEKKYYFIPLFYLLEKFAFLKAKIILIATKQKLITLKGKKFIYLPNGVDLSLFFKKNSLGKGMVFVGRLEKQKNLFFLIDAVAKLPKYFQPITFIGSGSLETNLKNYASKKKVPLTIIPPVQNTKLPMLLSKYSIFTLSSLAEGSPKVLLEAMAMGLVPVTTNFFTAKEVIKDNLNGFITKYEVNDYSQKLEMLIQDKKLYRKMSQNAVQTIINNFNLVKLINTEINIIKGVAQK